MINVVRVGFVICLIFRNGLAIRIGLNYSYNLEVCKEIMSYKGRVSFNKRVDVIV